MLGLRVNRLQHRPSLLDLITTTSINTNTAALPPQANLPPLPDSPTTTTTTSTSSITTPTTPAPPPPTHDNQNTSSSLPPSIPHPVHPPSSHTMAGKEHADEERGSVFSVSGSVVVAENMIGCAMYELVSCEHCSMSYDT